MKFALKLILALVLLIPFGLFLSGLAFQFSGYSLLEGSPYKLLGLGADGKLGDCPNKPVTKFRKQENCISSQDDPSSPYYRSPIELESDSSKAMAAIFAYTQKQRLWKIAKQEKNYFHIEVYSEFFGFVDDLELLIDDNKVFFRSSARLGFKDFDANQKHIEALRTLLKGI